jgi:hypothetical protein
MTMPLRLLTNVGEIWQCSFWLRRSLCPRTEDGLLEAVLIPAFRKRPPDTRRLRSLQILGDGRLPMPQLLAICRCPRPDSNFKRRTSLILRVDNLLASNLILPCGKGSPAVVSSATPPSPRGKHSARTRSRFR